MSHSTSSRPSEADTSLEPFGENASLTIELSWAVRENLSGLICGRSRETSCHSRNCRSAPPATTALSSG